MKKSINDALKEFWGTSRWDKLDELPRANQSKHNSIQNKEFLIEKYITQFPEEQITEVDRIRL